MRSRLEQNSEKVILFIQGRLDDQGATALSSQFNVLINGSWPNVVLDLGQVSFIGSTAIGRLLRLQEALTHRHASLALVNVPASILALFSTMHLDRIFSLSGE